MSRSGLSIRPALHLWSPLSPDEIQPRLEDRASKVTSDSFVVGNRPPGLHLPWMNGHYQAASGGTYLRIQAEVRFPQLLLLGVLLAIAGPIAPLVVAVMGVARYRRDDQSLEGLVSRLRIVEEGPRAQARLQDQPISDPTAEGALNGAPPSFSVRSAFDGATFHLLGAGGEQRRLEVSQQGVRLHRPQGTVRLDWVDLDQVDLQQGLILLQGEGEPVFIDVQGHPEDDRIWLALYLQSCQARWAPSKEQHERERARLAQLAAHSKRST